MSLGSVTAKNADLAASYGDNKSTAAGWPTSFTCHLYIGDPTTTGVVVSGTGYAGVVMASTTANVGTPSGGQLGPISFTFPTAGGTGWGTPDHWAFKDGSGNILDYGSISSPQAVGAGIQPVLSITLVAG